MSTVSRLLAQRVTPTSGADGILGTRTLADLQPGDRARISGYAVDLPAATRRRLVDLGFAPGGVVDVVRRAPAHDPVVYRVAETEMAIRRVLARGIHVERA